MTNEEIAVKIAEHNQEIGSLKHRVKGLEGKQETIHQLALSVQQLADNMQSMLKEQERSAKLQDLAIKRIEKLESKPAKNWDTLITVIITALASGFITYVLTNAL